jgi:hypothetical protein
MFSVGALEPGEKSYPKYTACDVFCRGPGIRRRRATLNICKVFCRGPGTRRRRATLNICDVFCRGFGTRGEEQSQIYVIFSVGALEPGEKSYP